MVKESYDIQGIVVTRPCTKKLAQNISLRNVDVDITQFQAIFLTSMKLLIVTTL